jgi:hypothetical protein
MLMHLTADVRALFKHPFYIDLYRTYIIDSNGVKVARVRYAGAGIEIDDVYAMGEDHIVSLRPDNAIEMMEKWKEQLGRIVIPQSTFNKPYTIHSAAKQLNKAWQRFDLEARRYKRLAP